MHFNIHIQNSNVPGETISRSWKDINLLDQALQNCALKFSYLILILDKNHKVGFEDTNGRRQT